MTAEGRLRILHVCCTEAFAGVERHVAGLAATQASQGHDVHVIGGDPLLVPSWIARDDVCFTPAGTVPQAVRAMSRLPRPSIVNVHMSAAELAAAASVRMRGVPVVSTRHFAQHRGSRWLSRGVVRTAARRIAAQISVSRYVADHVEGPSTVIHSGVASRPDAKPSAVRDHVVLVAQRLEPEKATRLALDAFAASRLGESGWRLDIAGGGSLRAELEEHAVRIGIADGVRFLGPRSDIEALMDSAALFLAPRPDEGYGLSALEAMAAGLPVVAAAGGGHLETVGFVDDAALFGPGDARHAGRLLAGLAEDTDARDAYGRALQVAQRTHFSLRAQADATDAVYRSVL